MPHLLTPGPTPMPEAVRQATGQPMVHHRSDAFRDLLRDMIAKLKTVFQTEHDVLVLTGSSTGAMEAAIVNTLSPGERVLAASAGRFGERWADSAQAFGTDVTRLRFPDGQAADPAAIQEALSEGGPFQALLLTHNETSTGVTNDLGAVGAVVGAMPAERRPLLLVDAVSSLGALELRTDAWGCDVVVSGSQKALMSPPGVSVVAVGPRAWTAAGRARLPRFYWDFRAARQRAEDGATPFTPAVSVLYALHAALALIIAEGLPNVFARHRRLGQRTRQGIKRLGLALFADEAVASDTVTAVRVPPGVDAAALLTRLRAVFGVAMAGGHGPLKGHILRIGHMGCISETDVNVVLAALAQVL
ncbi:MAG: alanine--glyoxylate aminotransferase family protein [Anaerolineae bacterium]|nr:MAG: alanine--glyoxylate aminotransferase family protein [Anaerolineae bacterium]